jgi:pro-kumamolisin-like protein/Big-like domain-containing protein
MCSMVRKLLLAGPMLLSVFSPYPLGWGQSNQKTYVAPRVTQVVDETNLFRLRGNTHPLARPELDMGGAPASLPMQRMLLVLRRSPEQESALRKLLDEQQDKSSANYHKWLTPEEFGRQFGPADQDIQAVSSWLQGHGFEVARVAKGRTVIEFSGTAGQVQEAFHTAIHKYAVKGEEHWANAGDPQIPAALTPVVGGVHTLHSFHKKPQLVYTGQMIKAAYTPGRPPKVTFPAQPGQPALHALAPADYATIYNINPLYSAGINGFGTSIAVVGRSDLFNGGQDAGDFRAIFGVNGNGFIIPVLDGPDPGDLGGGEEVEATLDVTWAGALAPAAGIQFVVSASTDTTDGVDLSELYIIDNNRANVMTESFGDCEQHFTNAQLMTISSLAEQAAAEGITYLVASGDSGSAGCDNPNVETVATGALGINALAASPFTVAVGGTMFNENGSDSTYWNTTNNPSNFGSAKSYIPENVWNESCTIAQCGQNANIFAGGGGVSTFFPKPSWQAGVPGIPAGSFRDVPDVSLTASGHDFYLLCLEGSCVPDSQGFIGLFGVAGTSAATPSFAAIMALINQKMSPAQPSQGRQGQADYVLYRLAAAENFSQCNASRATALPASTCVFNDVTAGNNSVPGEIGQNYLSGVGYDLATGLGSVNVNNLANNWNTVSFNPTTTTIVSLNPTTITHGHPVNLNITVTSNAGTPTGSVVLLTQSAQGVQQAVGTLGLSGGSFIGSISSLSGTGSVFGESVFAEYRGDGIFGPSVSNVIGPVTVLAESSTTTLKAQTLDQNFNFQPFTTGPYGGFVYLRADVSGNSKQGIPTGSVSFMEGVSTIASYNLNSQGNTATPNYLNSPIGGPPSGLFTLSAGSHSVTASYAGDSSFNASVSSPLTLNITPAATATTVASAGAPQGATLTATVATNSGGSAPSGNVTFLINGTQVGSPVPINGSQPPSWNPNTGALVGVQGIAGFTDTALANGQYTLTATYAGDTNYTGSSAAPTTIKVQPDFVLSSSGNAIGVSAGGAGSLVLTIGANDGFTGTVQFSCSGLPAEATYTFNPTTIAGSGTTTLTVSTMAAHQVAMLKHGNGFRPWSGTLALMLAGLCLLGYPRRWHRQNQSLALLVFALLLTVAGCGGGGGGGGSRTPHMDPGTPTGSYKVTVTASSGSLSHNVAFTLFVQ